MHEKRLAVLLPSRNKVSDWVRVIDRRRRDGRRPRCRLRPTSTWTNLWIGESVPIRDTAPVDPRIRPNLPNGSFVVHAGALAFFRDTKSKHTGRVFVSGRSGGGKESSSSSQTMLD